MMIQVVSYCLILAASPDDPKKPLKLFDGQTLKGWTAVNGGKYSVEYGVLVIDSGNGWLRSDKQYGDFDLTVEWRADKKYKLGGEQYDSGLFFRTLGDEKPWPKNKYQMNMKQTSGGELSGINKDGGLDHLLPPGEWNKYRLRVKGREAEAWINGHPVWKTDRIKTPKGYIGLQAEGYRIEFRRIELTPLE
jgi:hypothetical protein